MTSPSRESTVTMRTEQPSFMALSTIPSSPAPLIRSRGTIPEDLAVPGPGSYEISSEWKGNAIPWRPDSVRGRGSPSKEYPQELSPVRSQLSTRSTSFGAKLHTTLTETPGPCSYSPRLLDGRVSPRITCTFGSTRRDVSPRSKLQTPGPGAYDAWRPRGDGVSLKGRLRISTFETPGPGQYSTKSTIGTGLSKTIGTK